MSWIGRLFGRQRLEESLDRELRFHVDSRADDLVRGGMSRDEALRRARIELGGVEQVKEAARDERGTRMVEDFVTDVRYAFRGMTRTRVFSAAVILTLALGIGASTAVWSVLDALVFRALPVERPRELRVLRRHGNEEGTYRLSYPGLSRLREALPAGTRLGAMGSAVRMYASTGGQPEAVVAELVTGDWFSVVGVQPMAGRLLTPADDRELGGHPVAVVSEWYVRRKLGGDPSIVGKTIRVNGTPLTVVGIAQPGFTGLTVGTAIDMWMPVQMQHELRYFGNSSTDDADNRKPWVPQDGIRWLTAVTRVDPATEAAATAALARTYRVMLQDHAARLDSASAAYALREQLVLDPIAEGFSFLRQQYSESLRALMVGVLLLLLIACANVSGLLLARGAARSHEIAVRMALGARPERLMRQVMTESVTLALIGGALGLILARWGTQGLLRLASGTGAAVPLAVPIDGKLLAFAFGVSLVTGLLFGSAPALRTRRTDLHAAFKAGSRVKGAGHRLPLGRVMVVSQIALSVLLVTTAGLFVQTFQNLLRIETGYDRERVLTARIDLRSAGYADDQLPSLEQRLLDAVRAVPGVKSASISVTGVAQGSMRLSAFVVPGRTIPRGEEQGQENFVSPGFFSTVGLAMVQGRQFTDADREGAPRVTIVSEAAAKHFFGTTDVIGKRIGYDTPAEFEIVGLVKDARVNGIRQTAPRLFFYPIAQATREYPNSLEMRLDGPAEGAANAIKAAIASVDRGIPVREVVSLENLLQRGLVREKMVARLGAAFGGIALLLAGLGLYGVLGYSVSRRTNEMGVRLALGSSPLGVARVIMRDALNTVGAGLALGAALSLPAMGLLGELVWGLSPHDPATLARSVAMLLAVGALAGLLPAIRAARIDPVEAIRAE